MNLVAVCSIDFWSVLRHGSMVMSLLGYHQERHSIHTDFHNVNEDIITISYLGGRWRIDSYCGLFYRVLYHAPSLTDDTVASRSKKYQPLFSRG